jgi:transcriptional regulator with XRE-family HTH domain
LMRNVSMSEAAAEAYAAELCRIFGRNLRRIRRDADCNLSAMAERRGIDRNLMTAIERGKTIPSLRSLCRLALAVEREVPAMLMRTPTPPPRENAGRTRC